MRIQCRDLKTQPNQKFVESDNYYSSHLIDFSLLTKALIQRCSKSEISKEKKTNSLFLALEKNRLLTEKKKRTMQNFIA